MNYPKVRGYEVAIEYVSMHPMNSAAVEFWKTRERVITEAGYKVHFRGVDVRRKLGIAMEEPLQHVKAELVEPPRSKCSTRTRSRPSPTFPICRHCQPGRTESSRWPCSGDSPCARRRCSAVRREPIDQTKRRGSRSLAAFLFRFTRRPAQRITSRRSTPTSRSTEPKCHCSSRIARRS